MFAYFPFSPVSLVEVSGVAAAHTYPAWFVADRIDRSTIHQVSPRMLASLLLTSFLLLDRDDDEVEEEDASSEPRSKQLEKGSVWRLKCHALSDSWSWNQKFFPISFPQTSETTEFFVCREIRKS
jgi:hypothetical protein